MHLRGKRVTIMGLGHFGGGVSAARWLARRGAAVTVTDLAGEQALADPLAALDGEPIAEFHLGGHRREDFSRADMVVVNPAVRPGNPLLKLARDSGARLSSEIELFVRACAAPIVGDTGSNGKSTTAAMTAAVLQAAGLKSGLPGRGRTPRLPAAQLLTTEITEITERKEVCLYAAGQRCRSVRLSPSLNGRI